MHGLGFVNLWILLIVFCQLMWFKSSACYLSIPWIGANSSLIKDYNRLWQQWLYAVHWHQWSWHLCHAFVWSCVTSSTPKPLVLWMQLPSSTSIQVHVWLYFSLYLRLRRPASDITRDSSMFFMTGSYHVLGLISYLMSYTLTICLANLYFMNKNKNYSAHFQARSSRQQTWTH
jgi:hypothetical protein